jgi:hypothetical protein
VSARALPRGPRAGLRTAALLAAAGAIALAGAARGEWLQPDPSYREAQYQLRAATRDTVGRPGDAARLDSLGVALLRLGRQVDAEKIFRRVLAIAPADPAASAGLGKLALFKDRLAEAESLLALAAPGDPEALADLYATRLRRGDWAGAAALAPDAGQAGRVELLRRMAEEGAWAVSGPDTVKLMLARVAPVPLVRVRLNGQSVLFAVDTGASDLLLDQSAARRCDVPAVGGQSLVFWNGSRGAARNALVQRLELGALRIEKVPAGTLSLRRWSLEVNPRSETVAGVIGLNLLRRFTPTIDYARGWLVLRRPGIAPAFGPGAMRVPFQVWGESELTVYGSLAGGRTMALVVQTGLPECGIGAPQEVLDEIGVKPGSVARLMKNAGSIFQGRPWGECSVPSVVVGPVARDRVPGWSGALDSSELWRHGVRRDAVLAGEFFRRQRVTIDWERRELVLEEKD